MYIGGIGGRWVNDFPILVEFRLTIFVLKHLSCPNTTYSRFSFFKLCTPQSYNNTILYNAATIKLKVQCNHNDVIKWKLFCVTGPCVGETFFALLALCAGEFTGHRWVPCTQASDAELWCFLWFALEPTVEQTMETLVIRDATALIVTSL